jgi:hypothetical protein
MLLMLKAAIMYLSLNLGLMLGFLPTQPAASTRDLAPAVATTASAQLKDAAHSPSCKRAPKTAVLRTASFKPKAARPTLDAVALHRQIDAQVRAAMLKNRAALARAQREYERAQLEQTAYHVAGLLPPMPPTPPVVIQTEAPLPR